MLQFFIELIVWLGLWGIVLVFKGISFYKFTLCSSISLLFFFRFFNILCTLYLI
ncbi:unnamed protein product [Meloidogyne enterolobii]|uniref:Uncharacterized protein n=1 Tax=Meloidogyne enterolobii TaxID=390850 RepID=A0ACB1AQG3_MELEN